MSILQVCSYALRLFNPPFLGLAVAAWADVESELMARVSAFCIWSDLLRLIILIF